MKVTDKFIEGLAIQLFLTDLGSPYARPWGELWSDEKISYIQRSTKITENMIECGYIEY
jgi:hypothetical protein